jgi:putative lipoic acid-binding regulatory protein
MTEELLKFPCEFSIKIMGKSVDNFHNIVTEILDKHCGEIPKSSITTRLSKNANYISLTVMFIAQSRQQLNALYKELVNNEHVNMVL